MNALDLRPKLGQPLAASRRGFLLICYYDPAGIAAIYENIALWQKLSCYPIYVLNLWPIRHGIVLIPSDVNLTDYAGIIIHCTVAYNPDNLYTLDNYTPRTLDEYDGVKILMKQDEHLHTNKVSQFIGSKKFDLVLTCVSPQEREKVYPRNIVGEADFLQVFTGYVSPYMQRLNTTSSIDRPIDISYRGSIQPLSFGRLGFEKRKIGYDVARVAVGYPLKVDISSNPSDRIGGTAWFDFLGSSRAVLGVESGSNLFDFTGEVKKWCDAFEKKQPQEDRLSEDFYRKAHLEYLHKFEDNVDYAQISPRHLEAAATRSLQILYDGKYSDVLVPYSHFFPLQRNLANWDEAVDYLRDDRRVLRMVECAYEEIALNQSLQYESFVQKFDEAVGRALERKGQGVSSGFRFGTIRRRALVLAGHEPTVDPRIDWMAEGLSLNFEVCELGAYPIPQDNGLPLYERLSKSRTRARIDRYRHDGPMIADISTMTSRGAIAVQHLILLQNLMQLPEILFRRAIGALDADEEDLSRFRWYAKYFIDTNSALLYAARRTGAFDVIVAADMATLPAALVLAEEFGARVVYDAHEFWPQSQIEFRHWEIEFWSAFDRNLAQCADLRVTVSPQLANFMGREYGCDFLTVPNCVTRSSVPKLNIDAALERLEARESVIFIFLGGFTEGRGIDDLINAWVHVDPRALLLLQGPDNPPFKDQMVRLARKHGLLDERIFFPPPVDTTELIAAARQADVGIIPYAPSSINNLYCSPNKLSQYMAAGLPVISNTTAFVQNVISDAKIGFTVDFRNHQEFARVVETFVTNRASAIEMSRRARQFFDNSFNWEVASQSLYSKISHMLQEQGVRSRPSLDFAWSNDECLDEKLATALPRYADYRGSELKQVKELAESYRLELERLNGILAPIRTATTPLRYALRQWRALKQRGIGIAT